MGMSVSRLLMRSMLDRWFSLGLVVFSMALAVGLFLSVQNVQKMTRANFENSVANVDLVVAARGSEIQILLNSVFGIGQSAALVTAESMEEVSRLPDVAWLVPLSLGDSHRGFRVIGTNNEMFEHAMPGSANNHLRFADALDAVIGKDVSDTLGYQPGDKITLQHGVGAYGADHDDMPLQVAGIMQKTGTPFDRAIFIPVEASEALHLGWLGGRRVANIAPPHDAHDDHDEHDEHDHSGGLDAIDAIFVGLKDKRALIRVQRDVANLETERLMAVVPGVALSRIWQIIGNVDIAFRTINLLILALALLSMVALTLANMENRRREMATLRALGAAPLTLVGLMVAEAALLAVGAAFLGYLAAAGFALSAHMIFLSDFGFVLHLPPLTDGVMMGVYLVPAAVLANLFAIFRIYRATLNDGIMVQR
jgi:putative ABC transport system permease protein